MNHFLNGVARAVSEAFSLPGPIVEIGSYQVEGQTELAELRCLFPGKSYVGVDVRPGPGVDLQADVEALPHADASVGTVIAMNTFEHVPRFWRGFEEIRRVLRPDGALFISCPFFFKIHNHPSDYWRFTPAALELLLEDYPCKIIGWQGTRTRPIHVWALAFGEHRTEVSMEEFEHYRALLGMYARQPLSWSRRWRYRLGSIFFGRKLFGQYLQRENWETICLKSHPLQPTRSVRNGVGRNPSTGKPTPSMYPSASPTGTAEICCAVASRR